MPDVNLVVFSDVHLGNTRNRPEDIIKNIDRHLFQDYAGNPNGYQLVVIAGDLFDQDLSFSSPEVIYILGWMKRLLRWCEYHNVVLRVLEGTSSHDRKQPRVFLSLVDNYPAINFKYIDSVSVEIIDSLNVSLLYIPDDLPDVDKTLQEAKTKVAEKGLAQVDISVMHGQFNYQIPAAAKAPKHDESSYLALTKHYIFIGHVHKPSFFDRIIAQGSFDRLAHGEEEPKGYVKATINLTDVNKDTWEFVENTSAKLFKTIKVPNKDITSIIEFLRLKTKDFPVESYIRFEVPKNHTLNHSFADVRKAFPSFKLTKIDDEDGTSVVSDVDVVIDYKPILLTRDNAEEILLARLTSVLSDLQVERCRRLIHELK